jgi:hypothetical protein
MSDRVKLAREIAARSNLAGVERADCRHHMRDNYFRRRAEFCQSIARNSPPDVAAKFLLRAATWAKLAEERERKQNASQHAQDASPSAPAVSEAREPRFKHHRRRNVAGS